MKTDRAAEGGGISDLLKALITGRAVLVIGQRHSPGLADTLKRDIAAITNQPDKALIDVLSGVQDDQAFEGLRRALDSRPVSEQLVATAENPWAYVVTSAIDPQVHEAFRRPMSSGRQLRVLFAGHSGTLARTGTGTLTLLRLFGALEERDSAYRPPTSANDLHRRVRLEMPLVFREFPFLIGPGGQLAIAGVGADDWLDLEILALSCAELPEGSIHWFPSSEKQCDPDRLRDLFGNRLRLHSRPLPDEFVAASTTEERTALETARQTLLRPTARQITVRKSGGAPTVVTFSPDDWRRVSQVAIVLDDSVTAPLPKRGEDEERQAFRDFLYRVQRVPDWEGIARGFLFERGVAKSLLSLAEQEISARRSVHASASTPSSDAIQRTSRLPLLIEGPPASGKTRLLHWLAYHLRLAGHVVLYVFPTRGRTSFEQVERVCRLLEDRTQVPAAVIVDDLDAGDYDYLSELLASSGRRSVVIGTISSLRRRQSIPLTGGAPDDIGTPRASYIQFPISSSLDDAEADRFLEFLGARNFGDVPLARGVVQERLFLLLLYRLLPDSRGNIHLAVGQEYERLVTALDRLLDADADESSFGSTPWQDQLAVVRAKLFPDIDQFQSSEASSPFRHDPSTAGAVRLALFCSLIERPLALDLLLRTQGSRFLTNYSLFSQAMEETALLQETVLDAEGTVGVEAEHPFVADVTLRTLLPDRAAQLALLAPVIKAVKWDDSTLPGENPDQDYMVGVLQAVGPRGSSVDKFGSAQCLEQLIALLGEIRQTHGARLPQLLLLEANALRLAANVDESSFEDSVARCKSAIDILGDAEQILSARRPSASRSAQLQNVLTTRAVVHGYVSGACLREYSRASAEYKPVLREMLREHLDHVNSDTVRARSMGRSSYFPLDVSFWAHRDQLERLTDLTPEESISLLAKLESLLEIAAEEPIEAAQYDRYQWRLVDLAQLQGEIPVAETIAAELRARGDFSADCILARRHAVDPATRAIRSVSAARQSLEKLLGYAPFVFGSEEALALMHHLWLGAHLEDQHVGGEQPVFARCDRNAWLTWRQLLESRIALPANGANPYLNFCLGWTLLELDEPVKAMQILRTNEVLAVGNRRRVGTLVVVTNERGIPVEYSGTVRRLDGQQAVLYVPRLVSEVRVSPRVQAELATAVHIGDEWRFGIGVNYQGVLPWPLDSAR